MRPRRAEAKRALASLLVLVVIAAGAVAYASFSRQPSTPTSRSLSSSAITTLPSSSAGGGTTGQTTSPVPSLTSFSPTKTITVGTQSVGATVGAPYLLYPCNCSVYPLPGRAFPTLHDLVQDSVVWLANVTSTTTVSVKGVPFTSYNITNIETLYSDGIPNSNATGHVAEVAWVGGTIGRTTMNGVGYPTLKIGSLYVFFFGPYSFDPGASGFSLGPPPFGDYWNGFDGGLAAATTGGAQGLFYVQDGKVYSLDNLFPQDDAWLPVKANGEPLSQFITEIRSA